MPFEEFAVGPVDAALGNPNRLAYSLVELLAVVKVRAESSAYQKSMFGVDAKVTAIEQCVYVGPQEQSVVDPVLAAKRDWSDVGCLKHWPNLLAGYGASLAVRAENDGLEGLLAQPSGREPLVSVHRSWPMPWFA